jgi:alginate O-acetyltransferase complex protein AlgJ
MQLSMQKLFQFLLASVFLLVIALPSTIMLFEERAVYSIHEKRRLAIFPEWHWDERLISEIPAQISTYFSDHYGLRTKMIERNQHFKEKYFAKSSTSRVIKGENDWLFLNKGRMLDNFIGQAKLDESTLSLWQQNLIDKQRALKNLGIEYFFVSIPNKMTMYPENLPEYIRELAGITRLDQFSAYLRKQEHFDAYTDLEFALSAYQLINPQEILYYKTDTHWNSLGAFIAYRQIMQRLSDRFPELHAALDMRNMRRENRDEDADLAIMLGKAGSLTEPTYDLVPDAPCGRGQFTPVMSADEWSAQGNDLESLPIETGCPDKNLTALVIHDSFGVYIRPFLSESFNRVVFVRVFGALDMSVLLRQNKFDIYIDLRVERHLRLLEELEPAFK